MVIEIELPDALARQAASIGLLTPQALEALIRAEVRRRLADRLFEAADRLAAQDIPPMTADELEAEIQAARHERHPPDARGG